MDEQPQDSVLGKGFKAAYLEALKDVLKDGLYANGIIGWQRLSGFDEVRAITILEDEYLMVTTRGGQLFYLIGKGTPPKTSGDTHIFTQEDFITPAPKKEKIPEAGAKWTVGHTLICYACAIVIWACGSTLYEDHLKKKNGKDFELTSNRVTVVDASFLKSLRDNSKIDGEALPHMLRFYDFIGDYYRDYTISKPIKRDEVAVEIMPESWFVERQSGSATQTNCSQGKIYVRTERNLLSMYYTLAQFEANHSFSSAVSTGFTTLFTEENFDTGWGYEAEKQFVKILTEILGFERSAKYFLNEGSTADIINEIDAETEPGFGEELIGLMNDYLLGNKTTEIEPNIRLYNAELKLIDFVFNSLNKKVQQATSKEEVVGYIRQAFALRHMLKHDENTTEAFQTQNLYLPAVRTYYEGLANEFFAQLVAEDILYQSVIASYKTESGSEALKEEYFNKTYFYQGEYTEQYYIHETYNEAGLRSTVIKILRVPVASITKDQTVIYQRTSFQSDGRYETDFNFDNIDNEYYDYYRDGILYHHDNRYIRLSFNSNGNGDLEAAEAEDKFGEKQAIFLESSRMGLSYYEVITAKNPDGSRGITVLQTKSLNINEAPTPVVYKSYEKISDTEEVEAASAEPSALFKDFIEKLILSDPELGYLTIKQNAEGELTFPHLDYVDYDLSLYGNRAYHFEVLENYNIHSNQVNFRIYIKSRLELDLTKQPQNTYAFEYRTNDYDNPNGWYTDNPNGPASEAELKRMVESLMPFVANETELSCSINELGIITNLEGHQNGELDFLELQNPETFYIITQTAGLSGEAHFEIKKNQGIRLLSKHQNANVIVNKKNEIAVPEIVGMVRYERFPTEFLNIRELNPGFVELISEFQSATTLEGIAMPNGEISALKVRINGVIRSIDVERELPTFRLILN